MIRPISRLLLLLISIAVLVLVRPVWASVTPVTDLIEERAQAELGALLPPNGRIDIRMARGSVEDGEFIKEFWMDPDSGQFIANVVGSFGEVHRVSGLAVLTVEVPVPVRRMLPDEIIAAADLVSVELPLQRLAAFALSDPEDLIGQQVRRMLVKGRPVPRQSVAPPRVIDRGQKVKIRLEHGALSLTATGRAMTDAYRGQLLRVVNLSSNKTITAVATGPGEVEVDQ